jgi:hypothetical protein
VADQKVNCNVHGCADGSQHLVFTIEGTQQCVGEIRIAADMNYLLVISKLFESWANLSRLPSAIRRTMNGKHAANH